VFERDRCRQARDCDFVLVNLFHPPLGAPMRRVRSTSCWRGCRGEQACLARCIRTSCDTDSPPTC
jgi:hypothetical protein